MSFLLAGFKVPILHSQNRKMGKNKRKDLEIECPKPEGAEDIHYGVWVTIRKP